MRDETEIFSRVQNVVIHVLDQPGLELEPATLSSDVPGWDSMAMLDILLHLQAEFKIRFRTTEVGGLHRVADIVAHISDKIATDHPA